MCVCICIYTPDFTREEDYKYLSMQHNLYINDDEGKRILKEKKDNYSFLVKDFFRAKKKKKTDNSAVRELQLLIYPFQRLH